MNGRRWLEAAQEAARDAERAELARRWEEEEEERREEEEDWRAEAEVSRGWWCQVLNSFFDLMALKGAWFQMVS